MCQQCMAKQAQARGSAPWQGQQQQPQWQQQWAQNWQQPGSRGVQGQQWQGQQQQWQQWYAQQSRGLPQQPQQKDDDIVCVSKAYLAQLSGQK